MIVVAANRRLLSVTVLIPYIGWQGVGESSSLLAIPSVMKITKFFWQEY
jgi:hypothetical protein